MQVATKRGNCRLIKLCFWKYKTVSIPPTVSSAFLRSTQTHSTRQVHLRSLLQVYNMKLTITLLVAAAAAVVAQDTVVATASCEPHGDHWHCPDGVPEPTAPPAASASASAHDDAHEDHSHSHDAVSATASGVCEPHGDHWHCPDGVPEPTMVPGTAALTVTAAPSATASHSDEDDHDHEVTASTCEPHGDHWHCPDGVAEPTTAPAAAVSGAPSASASGTLSASRTPSGNASGVASTSAAAPAEQTANAAAALANGGKGVVAALIGAAAWLL